MCGILGILAFGELIEKKQEKFRQEAMIFLSSELLQLTQSRGKDATGIATLFSNCDYMGLKMGIPSTDFVSRFGGTEKDFDGYLNIWRKKSVPAKMVLGHCRKSSVGNPENNNNNHPIKVDDIIGVHNGTLTNHDRIFELLKCERDGTVDSEAIFRLLHHFTNNGKEPFSPKVIQEVCKRLHGAYSCLAMTGNNPYQMVGFRDARPMEVLLIKPLKLLLIASDKDFLKHVIFRYNKMVTLYQIGITGTPALRKTDIELLSLPDDTLYIFDIRKEIGSETKIKDLFISEKIPRINKIWDNTYNKSVTYPNRYKNEVGGYLNQPKITKSHADISKEGKEIVEKSRLGMAWNKDTSAYQDIVGLDKSKSHPSVEIDLKNGEIIDAETKKVLIEGEKKDDIAQVNTTNTGFDLGRIYNNVDSLIIAQATIKEVSVPVETITKDLVVTSSKTEVVLETYPEVLKKAGIALVEEENFNNTKEVLLALEIEKKEDLVSLPIFSLANRIKRFFYKKGWFNGYIACIHDTENSSTNAQIANKHFAHINNKRKLAEKNIRIMKNIIHIFSHITTEYQVDLNSGVGDVVVTRAINAVLSDNKELSTDTIKNVFKPGDFKKAPILEKMAKLIENNN